MQQKWENERILGIYCLPYWWFKKCANVQVRLNLLRNFTELQTMTSGLNGVLQLVAENTFFFCSFSILITVTDTVSECDNFSYSHHVNIQYIHLRIRTGELITSPDAAGQDVPTNLDLILYSLTRVYLFRVKTEYF